jgi:hypothetical protein
LSPLEGVEVRSFECDHCGSPVAFEATRCERCETPLGYVPDQRVVRALLAGSEPAALYDATAGGMLWRCLNAAWGCNWMVPAAEGGMWCRSCRLTRGRPDVARPDAIEAWMRAEADKRRLVHQLDALGLPLEARTEATPHGLVFDLVHLPGEPALTGHRDGVITLDLLEADDGHRDALRHQLDESFRTVLGHLRHEIGHHYWARLVGQTDHVAAFRRLFGDERADYTNAIAEHYSTAGRARHDDRHISHYAGSHPLEDWAETFAHYLHILDATGTATAHHLAIDDHRTDGAASMEEIVDAWRAIAKVINAVAASLGSAPIYPFVLSDTVVDKLTFVHDRIADHTERIRFYATTA